MAKPGARSSETKNVAGNLGSGGQAVSTHPNTRVIGTQVGAVKPATVPIPSISDCESRRQKPQNPQQPVSVTNLPTNESNASSLQVPLDAAARVATERTYDKGEK